MTKQFHISGDLRTGAHGSREPIIVGEDDAVAIALSLRFSWENHEKLETKIRGLGIGEHYAGRICMVRLSDSKETKE